MNVNFRLTPDEANRDPEGGGLIVWDKRAPANCDFARFVKDESAIRGALKRRPAQRPARDGITEVRVLDPYFYV